MIRHLRVISALSPSSHASRAAVYQSGAWLCGMSLEAGVVTPYIPPENCSDALLGYSDSMVLSGIVKVLSSDIMSRRVHGISGCSVRSGSDEHPA